MKRFMIFGSFSGTNAGDAAVLHAIVARLEERYPNSCYYVPTTVPSYLGQRWQEPKIVDLRPVSMRIRHCAYGFMSVQTLISIIRCDAVFSTANMFFDRRLFNPWNNFVCTLLPVLLWYRVFRPKGKVIGASISANPPTSRLGGRLLRWALMLHNYIVVRDSKSLTVLERLGIDPDKVTVSHDVVLGESVCYERRKLARDVPRIGINLSSYFEGELIKPQEKTVHNWIGILSRFVGEASRRGWAVEFVLTSSTDRWLADLVCDRCTIPIHVTDPSLMTFQAIKKEIANLDAYVTMRMHGAIFALNCGTPVLGFCFTEKMRNFFCDAQLQDFLIDLRGNNEVPPHFEVFLAERVAAILETRRVPVEPAREGDPFPTIVKALEQN